MKKIQLTIIATVFALAMEARAAFVFNLSYTDGANVVSGSITADYISGNQYHATGGTLQVTASSTAAIIGSYSLMAGGPGNFYSPSGAFIVNNLLYYPGDPYLDGYGLLGLGFASTSGVELNLWGNSPGNYSLYAWDPALGYTLQYTGAATTSITPVPEPTTIIAGALLMLPFAASTIRLIGKKRIA